jgi:hypothetical protein
VILMADFGTTLNSKIADFLAKYADADGSTSSVQIVSSGGDSTSVKLGMDTSVSDSVAETTTSAIVEAEIEGNTVSATADAAASGETASTDLDLNVNLEPQSAVVDVAATAEATGDEADITATASTDAEVSPGYEIVEFQQETFETPGDDGLTAESLTDLEAIWSEPLALESLHTMEEITSIETAGDVDLLF